MPGWLQRKREAAEQRRAEETYVAQCEQYAEALAEWQVRHTAVTDLLKAADGEWAGFDPTAMEERPPIQPRKGERVFLVLDGAILVEPRRQRGQYQAGTAGVSFRVMKGVTFRTGGIRGSYTPGPEVATVIDQGSITITNQRVVFQGDKQAREWAYAKMLGHVHDDDDPITTIHVSNRQRASGFGYTPEAAPTVRLRLEYALACYSDTVKAFTAELEEDLAELDDTRPVGPQPPTDRGT